MDLTDEQLQVGIAHFFIFLLQIEIFFAIMKLINQQNMRGESYSGKN